MDKSIVERINYSLLGRHGTDREYELISLEECPGGLISILLAPVDEKVKADVGN